MGAGGESVTVLKLTIINYWGFIYFEPLEKLS
jgi:hypothetical protein